MSEMRICDRCGDVIRAYKDSNPGFYQKTVRGKVVFWPIRDAKERDFDLCDTCYEGFLKWFEGGVGDDSR